MRKFSVSSKGLKGECINVGIAPGKFDTKQLILSSLVVLKYEAKNTIVRFVRTIDRNELAKCKLFINDDFTTLFPVIPSYHDVSKTWEDSYRTILSKQYIDESAMEFVKDSVEEKISNLEAIDCIMDLYDNIRQDSFEEAFNVTLKLIDKFINDSIYEKMYYATVKYCVDNMKSNFINPPVYIQGWRNIVKLANANSFVEYAIFPDNNNCFVIESYDKDTVMKKYVKGMRGVCYSGRFFVKVTNLEDAYKVIEKLPTKQKRLNENLA